MEIRPRWQRFLESTGGTALITVLVGGLFGQWISWSIQQEGKEREFRQSWLKARGDQALAAHTQYLDQEHEVVKRAYQLIGKYIASADNLIYLTGPGFNTDRGGVKQKVIREQIVSLRKTYNSVDQEWRNEREEMGLLVGYYHPESPGVANAWSAVRDALKVYTDCASLWNSQHWGVKTTSQQIEAACNDSKSKLRNQLNDFTTKLESARRYAWEGWDNPETLRALLESDSVKKNVNTNENKRGN